MSEQSMIKKWLIAAILIVIVAIAAIVVYVAYQPPGTSNLAPTVTHTSPLYGATGTFINTKILVTFSKAMDSTTITSSTITLKRGASSTTGTLSSTGVTATFAPSANLASNTFYTATVTTGVKDTSGNALAVNYVWSFTTGLLLDSTAPYVIGTSPVLGVGIDSTISATFSKAMNPSTITTPPTSTFTMKQGTTAVPGTVTYAGTTASFKPSSSLAINTNYTATITTAAKDLAGNAMKSNFVWTFTTSTSAGSCAQATVNLRSAANFAVLAYSTVTNTGPTTITNGDVGVSPGSAIDGFPPGMVSGTTSPGNIPARVRVGSDPASNTAQADSGTAYADAQGRTLCPILLDGNMGGLTLGPGLYRSGSSLAISSGDLTLDAGGNANAIFIFQIPSTLTTTVDRQVFLAGGAQAKNIFWAVGSSATLGTYSVLYGTILASASVTLDTGATLNGRALAQGGAVTLDSNVVTIS